MVLDRSEMRNCPECDAQVKVKNLRRHFKRIHGIEIGNSTADIERALKRKKSGMMAPFKNNVKFQIGFSIVVIAILSVSIYYGMIYEGSYSGYEFHNAKPFPIIINELDIPEEKREVKIPVNELTRNAQFYKFNSNGVDIRVFVLLGSDDEPRVAFDASESAYSEKKGFRQVGDKMVDNANGWEFEIDNIGHQTTFDVREPILSSWEYCCGETNVAIKIIDLEARRYLFE